MSQVIPEGWLEQPIGNIANVVAGGTPKAGNPDNFATPGSEIAWLTPADLSKYKSKFISHGARDLSQEGYDSSSAKLMPKGALLFSSRAPIGYVVIAENPICTNQGFKNFVFTEQVNSTYAFYYLKSIRDLAESLGSGTTFKELSGATAKTIPFRLAPQAEQKVIADKLDELLAQVESTKARLDAIPAILKSFRQSVLAAAVSGKLTEEWRGKTGVSAWSDRLLSEVTSNIVDCPHSTPKWSNNGKYCIRTTAFNPFYLDLTNQGFVSEDVYEDRIQRLKPEPDDILYSREGTVGIACQIPADVELCLGQRMVLIRAGVEVSSRYLTIVLNSDKILSIVQSKTIGSTVPRVNMKDIRAYPIPIPSTEEQTEIVRRVEELFAFADKVEAQVNTAQDRVNNLTQSILAKAFRGELTADWRAANPSLITGENSAKALLERIKAEREAIKKQPKPKRKAFKKKTGSKQMIKVIEALKEAGKPLSGQQLLVAAGYPSDSNTDQLETFFLDIRQAMTVDKSIVKVERSDDEQDWFALAKSDTNE
ncbi:restriction endonuclease subunit S [Shewanella hanedai]|uniref:Restriction endonuclease subunit S n=1 Tax=Shewanella hanedai TaxID=25 RepID=A0A553JR34_SHEHA|nr:restriction endonuclease subunit S [Shewanella hanedai]TRY14926.1 restriction endonuclease subunit S [Shewanella hanedai]GGI93783.1 restriction endonuclease subunit S [Shewanella hanedai]